MLTGPPVSLSSAHLTQEPALRIRRKGQPSEGLKSNRTFHSEFRQALADEPEYQRHATIDQFLLVCEQLLYKWQQVQFQYNFRNNKKAPSPADLSRDSKNTKSSQPPKAAPMATEVGEHCEGCGKRNHMQQDCTSGHAPKHPDFNEEGKWVGCASYKTIKSWLASHNRAGEHRLCGSTFAPMEHPWYLSRRRSRTDRPKETPGQTILLQQRWVPLSTAGQPAKRQRLSARQ